MFLLVGDISLKAQTHETIEIGKFSNSNPEDEIPPAWKPLTFRKIKQHTRYALVADNGVTVVKATSNASASGLICNMEINPKTYPVIGEYPPMAALNYIWASKAPVGTVVPDPYTDRSILIVVESGSKNLNKWVEEVRNVSEDYIKAFGTEPPPISGIAIMADSDNTKESTVSFFGDIVFRKE